MCVYIYTYIYVCINIYVYTYTYMRSSGSDIDDTTHDSLGKCRDSQYSKETWKKDFKTLVFKLTL